MDRSRLEWKPGLWLDARRGLWIAESRTLVVADLHLGYVWAHRFEGQLMPLGAKEDATERLLELIDIYQPREVVLLGDIVHRVIPAPALREALTRFAEEIGARAELRIVLGNHDAHLPALLEHCGLTLHTVRKLRIGPHLLTHGDGPDDDERVASAFQAASPNGRVIIGHEHPAITLSGGPASWVKCPCFLASPEVLVLPAFSQWAAGSPVRDGNFLSAFARRTRFEHGIAIVANKLLPVKLSAARSGR